jgi:hypothetical protein
VMPSAAMSAGISVFNAKLAAKRVVAAVRVGWRRTYISKENKTGSELVEMIRKRLPFADDAHMYSLRLARSL